jgi:hypothetical protein
MNRKILEIETVEQFILMVLQVKFDLVLKIDKVVGARVEMLNGENNGRLWLEAPYSADLARLSLLPPLGDMYHNVH